MGNYYLILVFVVMMTLIIEIVSVTTRPDLVCPEGCVCLDESVTLQCGNNFRSVSTAFSSITRKFKLKRDSMAPLLNGTFINLISVRSMDLAYSKINFIYSGAFRGLINMKEMNLQGNLLQSLDEHLFEESLQLESLDLSRNNLRVLPSSVFRFLPNLQVLNISFNRLTSVQMGVRFKVTTLLRVIDLSGNNIERISADDFVPAAKWDARVGKHLNLSSCNLKVIEPEAIESLGNIEHLGLRNNIHLEIDNITAYLEAIRKVNLRSLDLSNTDLSYKINTTDLNVDNLGPLSVQALYLSGNGFTEIDDLTLSYLNLNVLDLSHNHLTAIGEWTANMHNLEILDMSHNSILTIALAFQNCVRNMKTLKLSNNVLTECEKLHLPSAPNLETLVVSNNKFLTFHLPSQLSKLKHVDLSNNLIQTVNNGEVLSGLQNLLEFDVSRNKLTAINAFMFRSSRDIYRADFHGNLISSVSDRAFVPYSPKHLDLSHNELVTVQNFGWHGIENLNLGYNRIISLQPLALYNQNKLKSLNLNGNLISNIDVEMFTHLTNLTILELRGNNLTAFLPLSTVLAPLENLQVIDLSENNFSHFHYIPLPFSNNYELKQIKLSHNKIKVMSHRVFSSLPKLELLDFSRNPFDCSCGNLPLQKWVGTTTVEIRGQENYGYICHLPRMRGSQTLMNYSTKMFECDRYLFYVMVISSAGASAILIAVVIAVVCFLVKRYRNRKLIISDPHSVDLISHEKLSMNGTVKDKSRNGDYLTELRAKYLENNQSDTLIGVEFENPLTVNGHVGSIENFSKGKKKVCKKSQKSRKKLEKSKRHKGKSSKGKIDNKGVQFANGNCKHSEKVKKMLEYVDKEMKKDGRKKHATKDDHHHEERQRERRRRSKGNRDLVRLVSLRGSKSMPDVVRYINNLPRYADRYSSGYTRIPIYHVDHVREGHQGWARSLVDIPRNTSSSRVPVGYNYENQRMSRDYVKDRHRHSEKIPHGYHTIVGGRGRAVVDTRTIENYASDMEERVAARSRSPHVKHTVASIHGTELIDNTVKNGTGVNSKARGHSESNNGSLQLSQWL